MMDGLTEIGGYMINMANVTYVRLGSGYSEPVLFYFAGQAEPLAIEWQAYLDYYLGPGRRRPRAPARRRAPHQLRILPKEGA